MTPIPFEQLWNRAESMHQATIEQDSASSILEELSMKVNLYKLIDEKTEIPQEERQKIKARTMGEILLTLTKLSLKDNVNVYQELNIAMNYRKS
jgi:hypothetical protein